MQKTQQFYAILNENVTKDCQKFIAGVKKCLRKDEDLDVCSSHFEVGYIDGKSRRFCMIKQTDFDKNIIDITKQQIYCQQIPFGYTILSQYTCVSFELAFFFRAFFLILCVFFVCSFIVFFATL